MEEKGLAIRQEALPMNYNELESMSKAFVASGMFTDVKQISQAIVKVQAGSELGLPPVYSMQNINMIKGRLSSSANTLALLIKRSGKYNYRIVKHDEKICTIKFYEVAGKGMEEVGESTFSMDDAKRAGLIKPDSVWEKYPRAMLFSRAISQGARIYCPDAIGGIYTEEEMRSTLPHQDITITEVGDFVVKELIEEPDEEPIKEIGRGDITQPQMKKMMALCKEKGVDEEQLHYWIFEDHNKKSRTELTKTEAAELIDELEKLPVPDAPESTPEPVEEESEPETQEGSARIDLDWLKESLTILKKEFDALAWIKEAWGIDKAKVTDALLKMTDMQKARFIKEVQERLDKRSK